MRRLVPARIADTRIMGDRLSIAYDYGFAWRRSFGRMLLSPRREANPHIVVVGSSGYGKSTLLKSIISCIAESGRSALLFDGHNEHEELVESLHGKVRNSSIENINLFALDGLTVEQRIEELTSLLSRVYNLGYLQRSSLNSALYYTYRKLSVDMKEGRLAREPTIKDLLDELSIFVSNAKGMSERNRLEHIRQRIRSLERSAHLSNCVGAASIVNGINSFSMRDMGSDEAKLIYVHETVKRLYSLMKRSERERGIRNYIVIDESSTLIENAGSLLARLANEGRKFGFALIIVTNSSAMLPRDIVANSSTFIAFHIEEPHEIEYISNVIAKGNRGRAHYVKSMLEKLRQNQAIVSCSSGTFSVRCPCATARERGKTISSPGQEVRGENPSREHEDAVRRISERLSQLNVRHYLTNGKGPDIVAYCNGKVAIEYETGRKNFKETRRMILGREGPYSRTVVFVNDGLFGRYLQLFRDGIEIRRISETDRFTLG